MSSKQSTAKPSLSKMERILALPPIRDRKVRKLRARSQEAVNELAAAIIKESDVNFPFYIFDLAPVAERLTSWESLLPRGKPLHAVKSNPQPAVLEALAALGAGFSCESPAEIEAVLAAGVSGDRIIYANACKDELHLRHAALVGVNLAVFDSAEEVQMIKKLHPECSLLLGVKVAHEGNSVVPSRWVKDGALPQEIISLLEEAKRAGIAVVGVSFPIHGVAAWAKPHRAAVTAAKMVFDAAARLRLPKLRVIHFRGGFISGGQFSDVTWPLFSALAGSFPDEAAVSVIAETGPHLVESAFWLVVNITGKSSPSDIREYWINDRIYGSMSSLLHDHAVIRTAVPLRRRGTGLRKYRSTVFGRTRNALDTVLKDYWLPEMDVGDWLVFPNFNGFIASSIKTHLCRSS